MDINQAKRGAQLAFEIITLAKKEGWFEKSWSKLTVAGFLLTLFTQQLAFPLLLKNGFDIANLIVDIPTSMYWLGGMFTSLHMIMEKITSNEKK